MTSLVSLAVFAALMPLDAQATAPSDLKRHIYPLAKAQVAPVIEIDVTDSPESKEWAETGKALLEEWYGKLTQLLATDGVDPMTGRQTGNAFKRPDKIRLVFKKELNVPAYASGAEITISGKWIADHPDDLGVVIHEAVHVIQQYPNYDGKQGWLVEGIADYIRWWRYEPELHSGSSRTRINFASAKYTDAYRTTAKFLAWASRKYDMRLVPALDKAMRDSRDPMPVFEAVTGKSAEDLWDEFSKDDR